MNEILWEAARCLQRGWVPVPVELNGKAPALGPAWDSVRPTFETLEQYFTNRSLGVLLGAPSGHLIDIDLDCEEAEQLASWLPKTECRFGRGGRETHFLYYCPVPKTKRFQAPEIGTIIEIRSNGGQTVLPPSMHESGPRVWTGYGPPATIDLNTLMRSVSFVAGAALLARLFKVEGQRHDAPMALAGGLARCSNRKDWSDDAIRMFVLRLCEVAGHNDMADRLHGVNTTLDSVKNKQAATGWPKLIELIGKDVVSKATKWLNVEGEASAGVGVGDVAAWKVTQEGKDPPMWRVQVSADKFVRVPSETLLSVERMKLAITMQLGLVPQMPKKKIYDQQISDICTDKQFEERSDDAEYTLAVMDIVERWLATKSHAMEWDKLDEDQNLMIDVEGKKYEVTRIDLVEAWLRERAVKLDLHDLPELLRKMGFHPTRAPQGRRARCWVREHGVIAS